MKRHQRIRVLVLLGTLIILVFSLRIGRLFNTYRNFEECQALARDNPQQEAVYNNVAYRRAGQFRIYALSVEWDPRFYPNDYILITTDGHSVMIVELVSGPGPENVVRLDGPDAINYLSAMKLRLLR